MSEQKQSQSESLPQEKPINDSSSPIPNNASSELPKISAEEARTKLDHHRCAICQNVLMNACRIDCGHTFCRHCLNIDSENRNETGKRTCFICDAAVTEISQNTDKDKEIDELYSIMPTDDRLHRERTKSERKVEEESFSKNPKKQVDRNSTDSIASGDASYNRNSEADGAASWVEGRCLNQNQSSDESDDGGGESDNVPAVFRVGSPGVRSFVVMSLPSEEEEQEHDDSSSADRCCSCAFCDSGGVSSLNDNDRNDSYEDDGNEATLSASGNENGLCLATVVSDSDDTSEHSSAPPFTQPVIIQHTVQHIYHTVEIRNERDSSESGVESNTCTQRQRQSSSDHIESQAEWSEVDHEYSSRCSRGQGNVHRPIQHDDYNFYNNYYRNPGSMYSSAGGSYHPYYSYHHQVPVGIQHPLLLPQYFHPPAMSNYMMNSNVHPSPNVNMYPTSNIRFHYPTMQYDGSRECEEENEENDERFISEREICPSESFSEYRVVEVCQGAQHSPYSMSSINYENPSRHIPQGRMHGGNEEYAERGGEDDGDYYDQDSAPETNDVITFNVSIPISISENLPRRRDASSSRRHSHNDNEPHFTEL